MANTLSATSGVAAQSLIGLPRIALVGVHGFGANHLRNLGRLETAGVLELVAVADPNPPESGSLSEDVRVFPNLDELLAAGTAPDVVIIATPIQTHAALGLAALAAGADVYLEKPTAASMAQFNQLREAAGSAGRAVQIGFQSLGSLALPALAELISDGGLGTIRGYSATGTWVRNKAYYQRSRWAGKRTINGIDVVDGVTTNPLAHAVATALHIAGIRSAEAIKSVETDLYRAHDIEGDDTSAVRITPKEGPAVVSALTVCAPEQTEPFITVHGTAGKAVFHYTKDILEVTIGEETTRQEFGRRDLLENLLAHRSDGTPLLSSLENSGAFMSVLEAVRTAPDPIPVPAECVEWVGEGDAAHPVIKDVGAWITRATTAQATFSELRAPWARPAPPEHVITVAGTPVAQENNGAKTAPTLSPRPYLHPVTTLAGTTVTDAMPMDHVWHLGAGVAIQDVNGINFWGGRTYRRENAGYVWRPDHGRIEESSAASNENTRTQELRWLGPDGTAVLNESRTWSWREAAHGAWQLELAFTLTPAHGEPVSLGSPGSNGRPAGGYGGFFWRLPPVDNAQIRTPSASGEDGVHGTTAPWLAWSGDFDGRPATLVFASPPEADDPWFVRAGGYPGVGSSLAWDTPVQLAPGESLTRTFTVTIADGIATDQHIKEWTSRA